MKASDGSWPVIVLTIDGLGARMLGAYGGTVVDTPHLDRLAGESVVLEHALVDAPSPDADLVSLLTGEHAAARRDTGSSLPTSRPGTAFFTDDRAAGAAARDTGFEQVVVLEPAGGGESPASTSADDSGATALGLFLAEATSRALRYTSGPLTWIHARGLRRAWDAPPAYRAALVEEGDPDPPKWTEPPSETLDVDHADPDWLLGFQQAYAAEVRAIDDCVGAWLELLEETGVLDEAVIVFTSPRGYPLGEHGVIGFGEECLYGEAIHVPLWIRWPGRWGAGLRVGAIVQPHSLIADLIAETSRGAGPAAPAANFPGEDRGIWRRSIARWWDCQGHALCVGTTATALVVPQWMLVAHGEVRELYVKPDDRWEINNVADRCPDIVESLQGQMSDVLAQLQAC